MLDDPCQDLDLRSRRKILEIIDGMGEEMVVTLVYVTHHFSGMPACITHVLKLSRGMVVKRGTGKRVLGS